MSISSDLGFGDHIAEAETPKGIRLMNVFERSVFEFEFETTETIFRVRQHHLDRIDRIATQTLGEPQFWWIILLANDLFHPRDLEVGMELQIPEISEVFEFLESFKR